MSNFHVLGVGAIGSLLAYHLRRTLPRNDIISLVQRSSEQTRLAGLNGGNITLESEDDIAHNSVDGFEFETNGIAGPPIESIFVTTKAHATVSAITSLIHRISSTTTIVILQNGPLGVYKDLLQHVEAFREPNQRPRFILATNNHGAWLRARLHVVHAGNGAIDFGIMPHPSLPTPITEVVDCLDPPSLRSTVSALLGLKAALNTAWVPTGQLHTAMCRKLVVNAVVNPLTALMNCRNGLIFTRPEAPGLPAYELMQAVCTEAAAAFAAEARANNEAFQVLSLGPEALSKECLRVCQVTGNNISSMLADVRAGRVTEVEYLNGYLVALGEGYGIAMESTRRLYQLVKLKQSVGS